MKIKLTVLTMAMLIGSQVAYADGWIMWEHIETSDKGGTKEVLLKPTEHTHGFVRWSDCIFAVDLFMKSLLKQDYTITKSAIDGNFSMAEITSEDGTKVVVKTICYPSDFDPRGRSIVR